MSSFDEHRRIRESGTATAGAIGSTALLDEAAGETLAVRSQWRVVFRRFLHHRVATASLIIFILLIGAAIFADVLSPYNPNPPLVASVLTQAREAPSAEHLFGTDKLGRDQFSRVLVALGQSLQVGLGVALLSTIVGVFVGSLAGYYRGWIDSALMRFTDLFLVLPALAVLLIAAKNPEPSFFGLFNLPAATSTEGMILLLAALGWMPMARIVRGEYLSLREREFVEAARAAGAKGPRIILRHLLPNSIGPIVVFATLAVGLAILTESTLSFLGAGVQVPGISLGNMIADAEDTVGTDLAYLILFPGLVLFLIVLCVNFIGDGLRDALNPRSHK